MAGLASINIKFKADLTGFSSEMQNSLRQIDAAGQKIPKIRRSMSTCDVANISGGRGGGEIAQIITNLNKVDVSLKNHP
jgi:hypothetical protein